MSFVPRLYLMLKPPRAVIARLLACRSAHGLDDSYPHIRLHCTLLDLGEAADWPAEAVARLVAMLGSLQVEPFPVAFDRVDGAVLRGRARLPAVAEFAQLLARRAAACGPALPDYNFALHMRLTYQSEGAAGSHRIDPIGWLAEEFLLVRSIPGQGHEELGGWPLLRRQYALAL